MPTLYVENVPEDSYEAIRTRAQRSRSSLSAGALTLFAENVPTPHEVARRKTLTNRVRRLRSRRSPVPGSFPSAEEMLREGRSR